MTTATRHKLDTIGDIERKNSAAGQHFFDADTLRFFSSRIQDAVIAHRYFVTSEKPPHSERRSTIRCIMDDGSCETVGEFLQFGAPAQAFRALEKALAAGIEVRHDPYPDVTNPDSADGFNWRAYVGELPIGPRTDKATAEDQARQGAEPGYCYPGHAQAREDKMIAEARERGADAAKAAASWVTDGNSDIDERRRVLAMMRNGDPAADDYLPREPDLSGEFADDLTPRTLLIEISGDDYESLSHAEQERLEQELSEAFEDGVRETFTATCEAELIRFCYNDPVNCPGHTDDVDCEDDPQNPCRACWEAGEENSK
jgi:hypothetical protein